MNQLFTWSIVIFASRLSCSFSSCVGYGSFQCSVSQLFRIARLSRERFLRVRRFFAGPSASASPFAAASAGLLGASAAPGASGRFSLFRDRLCGAGGLSFRSARRGTSEGAAERSCAAFFMNSLTSMSSTCTTWRPVKARICAVSTPLGSGPMSAAFWFSCTW